MFEWIGDAVEWVGEKLFGVVESVCSAISSAVKKRRNTAVSDCRGKSVYIFRSQRIRGRLQQLVQADFRFMSDCVFTDQSAVFGSSTI